MRQKNSLPDILDRCFVGDIGPERANLLIQTYHIRPLKRRLKKATDLTKILKGKISDTPTPKKLSIEH